MSSSADLSSSPRKRGRPPKKKKQAENVAAPETEASKNKRLRELNGITKDIKILLRKCDAKLNSSRDIDLPPPILKAHHSLIPTPDSSVASYPPPILRREVNATIRPEVKSKKKKHESLHKTMAPGVEISSPRSSKRFRTRSANPSSSSSGIEVGLSVEVPRPPPVPPSSPQVSPQKKLSRYPSRLRSTRSGSNSQDKTESKLKPVLISSLATFKARKIKQKILESQLSSPSPPSPVAPPSTTQVTLRSKRKQLPKSPSRSDSEDVIEVIEEEPITSLHITGIDFTANERQISCAGPSPTQASPKINRDQVLKSTSPTQDEDEEIIVEGEGPSVSLNATLSSKGSEEKLDFIEALLASPPRVSTTSPTQVSPTRARGRPRKLLPDSDIVETPREPSTSPGPAPGPSSLEDKSNGANSLLPEQLKSPLKTSVPNELNISQEIEKSSVIITRSPSRSQASPQSEANHGTTSPPRSRIPSQVIPIHSPSRSPRKRLEFGTENPTKLLENSRDIDNMVVTNGPLLPPTVESEEETETDDLRDFKEVHCIRKRILPKAKTVALSSETNSLSCTPSTSRAANEKEHANNSKVLTPSPPVPVFQNAIEITPTRPTNLSQQYVFSKLPTIEIETPDDSTDEDENELPVLEISELKSLANSTFRRSLLSIPPSVVYYCCVMWDFRILGELQSHEDSRHRLFSANSIGKLLSESVKNEGHSFPGVAEMDWKRKFILLDIIIADFSTCGIYKCLRVQEKASIDTVRHRRDRPPKWEIVIHPQCWSIGEEMVRMHRSGVKTTVAIWGAHISTYPQPWNDIQGEMFLAPAKTDSEALSVIIFHHEVISHERFRLIQDAQPGSELWPNFQYPQLHHRILMQAELVHRENPTHFTFHAEKLRNPSTNLTNNVVNIVEAQEEEDCEVAEFPEFDSCDDEDFEIEFEFGFEPDPDEWDDLESASSLGAAENLSSPDVQASVSQDMQELAERIFRRSYSVPAMLTTSPNHDVNPPRDLQLDRESVSNSIRDIERRMSDPPAVGTSYAIINEGAGGNGGEEEKGAVAVGVMKPNQGRVVSDSQKQYLLTQELIETDDEDEVDNGNANELDQTVLTCDDDFVTGDEGPSPLLSPLFVAISPSGTKDMGRTNLCNGYEPKKVNGKVACENAIVKNVNGTEKLPPSNSEHSEYNLSALLQEF